MKILVALKRVPDYEAKIKIKPDASGIETDGVKWIINPFDEIAVEEAIRLKQAGQVTEVVVVGIGPSDVATQLRYAMAMGADSAILVKYEGPIDSDLASRVLAAIYAKSTYSLVIMGKQAIDSDSGQTAQLLAARLGIAQACCASKVEIDAQSATVKREIDGGLEVLNLPLPCVVSTDLRLNTPRYASAPNIMKAKKKPIEELGLADLGVDPALKLKVLRLAALVKRKAGRKVESVEALVKALHEEAKVI